VTCDRFWWFSPGPSVSSTNKTNCHDIAEILLKVALNTRKPTKTKPLYVVLAFGKQAKKIKAKTDILVVQEVWIPA
jgi:hypothetical protein